MPRAPSCNAFLHQQLNRLAKLLHALSRPRAGDDHLVLVEPQELPHGARAPQPLPARKFVALGQRRKDGRAGLGERVLHRAVVHRGVVAQIEQPYRAREPLAVQRVGDEPPEPRAPAPARPRADRKSTRLNSSHSSISYAVFCLKKKKKAVKTTATAFCWGSDYQAY